MTRFCYCDEISHSYVVKNREFGSEGTIEKREPVKNKLPDIGDVV